jgi:hypothetical protein
VADLRSATRDAKHHQAITGPALPVNEDAGDQGWQRATRPVRGLVVRQSSRRSGPSRPRPSPGPSLCPEDAPLPVKLKRGPKAERPETIAAARKWDAVANAYQRDSLCRACAGQAAWGHQVGFSLIKPPCPACAPVVAMFPQEAAAGSGWRRYPSGTKRSEHGREATCVEDFRCSRAFSGPGSQGEPGASEISLVAA